MRWVIRVLLVVGVAVGLAFSTLALIPSDRIAALAAGEFTRLTGRELRIEGAVSPTIWPVLGVRTGKVTLGNAGWSDGGPMLSADSLAIGVDLLDLLAGKMRITELALLRPDILLERSGDGQVNWSIAQTGGSGGTSGTPLLIEAASITDGRIRFADDASGRQMDLTSIDLAAEMPDPAGDADLTLTAETGGVSVDLSATVTGPAALFAGEVVPATLTAIADDARLTFEGRAGLFPFAAEGTLDADLADLAAIAALAGMSRPALPKGWGAGSVTLGGNLTVTAQGTLHLRDGALGLDERRFTGDADLLPANGRMRLVAQVVTGDLAVASAAGRADASGWPDTPIDTAPLGLIDADIGFRATSLDLGPMRLGAVNGQILLDRAQAELTLAEASAYGGAMSGKLVANARDGLSLRAEAALKGVSVQPLLVDLAGIDTVSSTGDLTLSVAGSGASVARIMADLSGQARLSLGPGTVKGLDLAGLMATLDPARAGNGTTAFDSLTGSFSIAEGDMSTNDLVLQGQLVSADGAGRIGLAARNLDLRFQTRALTGADGTGGLGIPVLVTGPWSAPRIGLDLDALAAERIEKTARSKAEEKIGLQDGETLEDAAKRKLDEEIQRGIGKALEGLFGD